MPSVIFSPESQGQAEGQQTQDVQPHTGKDYVQDVVEDPAVDMKADGHIRVHRVANRIHNLIAHDIGTQKFPFAVSDVI